MDGSSPVSTGHSNGQLETLWQFGSLHLILSVIDSHLRIRRVPRQDREDVRQEVLLRLLLRGQRPGEVLRPQAYVASVIRNTATRFLAEGKRQPIPATNKLMRWPAPEAESPGRRAPLRMIVEQEVLPRLSIAERDVFHHLVRNRETLREAARSLGMDSGHAHRTWCSVVAKGRKIARKSQHPDS